MKKKTAFYYDEHVEDAHGHLWFVISEPNEDKQIMLVNVTTLFDRKKQDTSCVLDTTDHECIEYPSIIFYKKAKECYIEDFDYIEIKKVKPLSKELLLKVQEGAKKSDYLPKKFYKYFDLF